MITPFAKVITLRPTIDTAIYAANDIVGGLQTLTGATPNPGATVLLTSLHILDEDNEKAALNLTVFAANPSDSTTADQAGLTLHANDRTKPIASFSVTAADYTTTLTGVAQATLDDLAILCQSKGTNDPNLYLLIQAVGTPTYTGADDLIVHVGVRGV